MKVVLHIVKIFIIIETVVLGLTIINLILGNYSELEYNNDLERFVGLGICRLARR